MFFFLIIVLLNGLPSLHLADEVHNKNLKVMSTYRPPLEHFVNTNRLQYKRFSFVGATTVTGHKQLIFLLQDGTREIMEIAVH